MTTAQLTEPVDPDSWACHPPVLRPAGAKGFVVLPRRWVVERTFAWLSRHRRHPNDYERTTSSSEAVIYAAMIGLMCKRLAKLKN